MSNETEMSQETIYGMLREIKSLAMQSSLTGGLRHGSKMLVDVYNRCLDALTEQEPTISKLFSPLSTETDSVNMDEIGVAAALLSRYVKPEIKPTEFDEF